MILTQTLETDSETSATVMGLVSIIADILPPTGPLMTSCNDLVRHHLTVCLKLRDTNFKFGDP